MTLDLLRTIFTDQSTIGVLSNEGWSCWILEPPGDHAIPQGRYVLALAWSPKNAMVVPHILHVPDRTMIEIHPGNSPADTHGCLLPGITHGDNFVFQSKVAFHDLLARFTLDTAPWTLIVRNGGLT